MEKGNNFTIILLLIFSADVSHGLFVVVLYWDKGIALRSSIQQRPEALILLQHWHRLCLEHDKLTSSRGKRGSHFSGCSALIFVM